MTSSDRVPDSFPPFIMAVATVLLVIVVCACL